MKLKTFKFRVNITFNVKNCVVFIEKRISGKRLKKLKFPETVYDYDNFKKEFQGQWHVIGIEKKLN